MPSKQYSMDGIDEHELQRALVNRLRGWKQSGKALERTFEFVDFRTALAFVNEVGDKAEDLQHHPDIDIRYSRVKLILSSHDANEITRRDLILAGYINEIAPRYQRHPRSA